MQGGAYEGDLARRDVGERVHALPLSHTSKKKKWMPQGSSVCGIVESESSTPPFHFSVSSHRHDVRRPGQQARPIRPLCLFLSLSPSLHQRSQSSVLAPSLRGRDEKVVFFAA